MNVVDSYFNGLLQCEQFSENCKGIIILAKKR